MNRPLLLCTCALLGLPGILGLLASCGNGEAASAAPHAANPARGYPAGTVLLVNGEPVLERDIIPWVLGVELAEPDETRPSHLRKVFANITLPRVLAAQIDPEARERALLAAEHGLERLLAGEDLDPEGPALHERQGGFFSAEGIGLDVWSESRSLPLDEWTLLDSVGCWVVFRVLEAPPYEEWDGGTKIRVEKVIYPYLEVDEPRELVQRAIEEAVIVVIDPAWEEILPAYYKYSRSTAPPGSEAAGESSDSPK